MVGQALWFCQATGDNKPECRGRCSQEGRREKLSQLAFKATQKLADDIAEARASQQAAEEAQKAEACTTHAHCQRCGRQPPQSACGRSFRLPRLGFAFACAVCKSASQENLKEVATKTAASKATEMLLVRREEAGL